MKMLYSLSLLLLKPNSKTHPTTKSGFARPQKRCRHQTLNEKRRYYISNVTVIAVNAVKAVSATYRWSLRYGMVLEKGNKKPNGTTKERKKTQL